MKYITCKQDNSSLRCYSRPDLWVYQLLQLFMVEFRMFVVLALVADRETWLLDIHEHKWFWCYSQEHMIQMLQKKVKSLLTDIYYTGLMVYWMCLPSLFSHCCFGYCKVMYCSVYLLPGTNVTITPSSLASLRWFTFLVLAYPDCPGNRGHLQVFLLLLSCRFSS